MTVTLDLAGHTINRALTTATSNGYVIKVGGNLTINDSGSLISGSSGTITGCWNSSGYGGCVNIGNVVKVITNGLKGKGTRENFVLNGRDGHALVTNADGEVGIAVPYSLTVPAGVTVSGFTEVSVNTYEVGCGEVVTLLYGGDVNSGYSVRYTVPNGAITYLGAVDAQGKCAEFTMPGSNMTITKTDNAHYTFGGITLKETFSGGASQGLDATFDGTSEVTVDIPHGIRVKSVEYQRNFTVGTPATVMLPFSLGDGQTLTGGSLYKFSGVEKQGDKWIATMTETTTLQANTPYLLMPDDGLTDDKLTFGLNGGTVTLNTTTAGGSGIGTSAPSDWEFNGTYEERHWYDGTDGIHSAENATEIGSAYGFAATNGKATDGVTDVAAGDFVKFASGAWLRPMRCYLTYTGSGNPWVTGARGMEAVELPSSISVVLVNADGETTEIKEVIEVNEVNGVNDNSWYTLDGRKLSGKPSSKGVYIVNGKKRVIK